MPFSNQIGPICTNSNFLFIVCIVKTSTLNENCKIYSDAGKIHLNKGRKWPGEHNICCFITIELRDPEYHALLPAEKYYRVIGTSVKLKTETSSLKNHSNELDVENWSFQINQSSLYQKEPKHFFFEKFRNWRQLPLIYVNWREVTSPKNMK